MTDKLLKRFVITPILDMVVSEDGTQSIRQGRELVIYSSNGVELSRITATGSIVLKDVDQMTAEELIIQMENLIK
jgi:hypothetical protein